MKERELGTTGLKEANMSTATASAPLPAKAPALAAVMRQRDQLPTKRLCGGPRPWKFAWVINFQKTGAFPLLGFLIAWYHNTSTAA